MYRRSNIYYWRNVLQINPSQSINDVSCYEDCDGLIDINVSGGVPASSGAAYTYLWNDVLFQTANPAIGLCAGSSITAWDTLYYRYGRLYVISNSILVSYPMNLMLHNFNQSIDVMEVTGDLSITTMEESNPISFLMNGQMEQHES